MKKIIVVMVMLLLVVGCTAKDEFGLGVYKGNTYQNDLFNMDFKIPDSYSFLTAEELLEKNKMAHEMSGEDLAKYFNNIINISTLSGAKLIAYVDSTPNLMTTEEREANEYLDFLTQSDVAYKLIKDTAKINGLEYYHIALELDFDGFQDTYIAINHGKLINIQVTYTSETKEVANKLMEMVGLDVE